MTTSTQTQLRRGTNTQVLAMTPVVGEVVVDTTNSRLYVGDNTTAGGIPQATAKDLQKGTFVYPTISGTANAITGTNVPAIGSLSTPLRQIIKATANNTSSVTYAPDGLTAKSVKKMLDGALTDLVADDIVSGGIYELIYDGTQWQIQGLVNKTPAAGALKFLGSATASSSATIDLTSLISSTYDDYMIVIDNLVPATNNANLAMRTSTDNGSTFAASSNDYLTNGAGATGTPGGTTGSAYMIATNISNSVSSSGGLSGKIFLYNLNATDTHKNFTGECSVNGTAASTAGARQANTAINALRFLMSSGNIAQGTFKLYGIAKS